jgi:hypothetical protein
MCCLPSSTAFSGSECANYPALVETICQKGHKIKISYHKKLMVVAHNKAFEECNMRTIWHLHRIISGKFFFQKGIKKRIKPSSDSRYRPKKFVLPGRSDLFVVFSS